MEKNYGIMRMKKLTDLLSVHNVSEHDNRNDYDMKSLSHVEEENQGKIIKVSGSGDYSKDYKKAIKAHTIGKKGPMVQKTSIPGWNIVMTATSFESIDKMKWIKANQEWLEETFGKSNVHTLVLHEDEQTPHLHCFVTPFHYSDKMKRYISGAKHWTGGPAAMRNLQNSYYEKVSKQFGLERGEAAEITNAKHTEPGKYREAQELKTRKSIEEYFDGLTPQGKSDYLYRAFLMEQQLNKNDKRYSYYKSVLDKLKKSHSQLVSDMQLVFSKLENQKMGSLVNPVVTSNVNGKTTKQVQHNVAMQTAFKLGAMIGAFAAVGSNEENARFLGMDLIDIYMKVLGMDFEQAKKLIEKKEQNQEM